jgi:hypothetical protein
MQLAFPLLSHPRRFSLINASDVAGTLNPASLAISATASLAAPTRSRLAMMAATARDGADRRASAAIPDNLHPIPA